MSRRIFIIIAIFAANVMSGCGLRHQYSQVVPDLQITGNEQVVAGVADNRPYVVNKDKDPSFVGLMRSSVGIPYDVNTDSKKAFAQEVADAACRSLVKSGFRCSSEVFTPVNMDTALAQAMTRQNATKGLLFTLNEWKVDTWATTSFWYDIQLVVRNRDGQTLASNSIKGKAEFYDELASEGTPKRLKQKLEELLNNKSVLDALKK